VRLLAERGLLCPKLLLLLLPLSETLVLLPCFKQANSLNVGETPIPGVKNKWKPAWSKDIQISKNEGEPSMTAKLTAKPTLDSEQYNRFLSTKRTSMNSGFQIRPLAPLSQ